MPRTKKLSSWEREKIAKELAKRNALKSASVALRTLLAIQYSVPHKNYTTIEKAHDVIAGLVSRLPRKQ